MRESLAGAPVPAATRRSLAAQRLVIVTLAAGALRWRQFLLGPPGKQPRLHVLVLDVVTGPDLAIRLANLGKHAILVGHIGLDRVRDQKVGTASRCLRQFRQSLLDCRLEPDTKGRAACVRHEHTISRWLENSRSTQRGVSNLPPSDRTICSAQGGPHSVGGSR